jgi:hypothetical protein
MKGRVVIESPKTDTTYRFDFKKAGELYMYRIENDDDGFYLIADMGDVENKEKEWGGEEDPEEQRRLDLFMEVLKSCTKKLGKKSFPMLSQVKAPAAEPAPSLYGYADPARRAEPDAADELAESMGKLSVGKGRKRKTRRSKKRRATRRR